MDSDPNDDPEFVGLFTISDTDADSDSDDDSFTACRTSLQHADNQYNRTTRVQQANWELFSQPNFKKKPKSKVKFDLVPQSCGEAVLETGDGDSVSSGRNKNHNRLQQRRNTPRVVLLPRRFSSLQYHKTNNNPDNLEPSPNQNVEVSRSLGSNKSRENNSNKSSEKTPQKEEKLSSVRVVQVGQPPRTENSEERLLPPPKQNPAEPRPRMKHSNKNNNQKK